MKLLSKNVGFWWGAEGGTRTPMPVRAQRPERCVSTNFTTSARCGQAYITVTFATCQELSRKVVLQTCYNYSENNLD